MSDAEDLVRRFLDRSLPKHEWTHTAHLIVGAWHVHRWGPVEAMPHLRRGIRMLNDAHGTANTASSGYHETVTRAYATLIDRRLVELTGRVWPETVADLLASRVADRDVLLDHYSRDVLFSPLARTEWVPPDRKPFDAA